MLLLGIEKLNSPKDIFKVSSEYGCNSWITETNITLLASTIFGPLSKDPVKAEETEKAIKKLIRKEKLGSFVTDHYGTDCWISVNHPQDVIFKPTNSNASPYRGCLELIQENKLWNIKRLGQTWLFKFGAIHITKDFGFSAPCGINAIYAYSPQDENGQRKRTDRRIKVVTHEAVFDKCPYEPIKKCFVSQILSVQ